MSEMAYQAISVYSHWNSEALLLLPYPFTSHIIQCVMAHLCDVTLLCHDTLFALLLNKSVAMYTCHAMLINS